ncbi:uncharacterized protein LOC126975349 isoform X1 [Leptidea sinapis]|uniref:uncharacterized protein LOC126975349 isoform X1 n=1 Tax=Leptidea sinapis TaxID=189913 RepID=UPI002143B4B4|nr:uncharacterized protein LOC126975349 isoform X1 [Leptidea sinapis]
MKQLSAVLFVVLISHAYGAPQFITFKDGKLGVNFGGYHAGVGIGGLLGNGAAGGLYAEAGTPHGQSARAGLGGSVSENGGTSGGLYAGATAGGNIKASAGLGGSLTDQHSTGGGFASAQAGNNIASTGLGGATVGGSSGIQVTEVKNVNVIPESDRIEAEVNINEINEVQPISQVEIHKTIIKERSHLPPPPPPPPHHTIIDEVHIEKHPHLFEKEIVHAHYKPRKSHFRKTAFLGGYVGGQGDIVGPPAAPAVEERVDVNVEKNVGHNSDIGAGASTVYTKQVSIQRNPSFFEDIFNIPISTLKAVGSFLGNTAGNTNISVHKSVHADDSERTQDPSASSSSSSSTSQISVETPNASSFIDDIFAIPISTLGAVNRFLENNVARKNVQVQETEEYTESKRVRRVPHGRRRANRRINVE